MKVTREKVENSQAYLSIEMEPAEVESSLQKAYQRLVKKANIPGFRKGKAPRPVLERYVGRESLLEEALNQLVPEAYEKAVKEQELEPIAQPRFEVTQTEPVVFKAVVPLRPTVKLGDYRAIRLTPPAVEFKEESVEAVMERLRHEQATWEPAERPAELGDLVVLDLEGRVDSETLMNRPGLQLVLRADSTYPAPGFATQVAGLKTGEEKEFQLTLPSEYPRKELAGKEASFKVKLSEVKLEKLPELNDEFAKAVSPETPAVAAFRERVASEIKKQAEEKAREDFEEQVLDKVVETGTVEFPPVLVENEVTRMLRDQSQRLRQAGAELEAYLRSINKTEAELGEELRPTATKRVTRALVLDRVAVEEKVEVTPQEIDAEVERMLQSATTNKEELGKFLNAPGVRDSLKESLLTRKTIARLVELAKQPVAELTKPSEEQKA